MSRPIRALHIVNGEYFGGSARVLMNFLESPRRRCDAAVIVMFDGELRRRSEAAGIETRLVTMRSRIDLLAARRIVSLVRRFRADLIHTHQVRNTLLGRIAGAVTGVPVVTHVHSPAARESTHRLRNWLTSGIDQLPSARTARFITVSHSLADELSAHGVERSSVRIVHNGIEMPSPISAAQRRQLREELGLTPDDVVIGMMANFRPRKGTESLIDAVGAVATRGAPVRLVLVGEPFREPGRDYGSELRERAERSNAAAVTMFTGFRRDADAVMATFDIFVLPSLFGEGLPMVLLEAMAAGIPVISTPVEGIPEVIRDGENGILVDPGDDRGLAVAIEALVADRMQGVKIGAAGRETIMKRFTTDQMVDGIETVYEEVVRRERG